MRMDLLPRIHRQVKLRGSVNTIAWSPNGRHLAAGSGGVEQLGELQIGRQFGSLVVVDAGGAPQREVEDLKAVAVVVWSACGERVATATGYGQSGLRVLDWRDGEVRPIRREGPSGVQTR